MPPSCLLFVVLFEKIVAMDGDGSFFKLEQKQLIVQTYTDDPPSYNHKMKELLIIDYFS
jgi:hypothetical protein